MRRKPFIATFSVQSASDPALHERPNYRRHLDFSFFSRLAWNHRQQL